MKEIEKNLNGTGLRIGIVQSRFNTEVCEGLLGACRTQLAHQGVREDDITLATVPGALEIALVLQRHGPERQVRRADRARRGDTRRYLSFRGGIQRIGALRG